MSAQGGAVCLGGVCSGVGGVCPGMGVSAQEGVCLGGCVCPGGCLPGWFLPGGYLPRGRCTLTQTPVKT